MSRPFCCPNRTARQSTLLASFAHQGPELDSAALSTPDNTKETNPTTTGDHHAEQNTRRRTVHRRKHRGRTENNSYGSWTTS